MQVDSTNIATYYQKAREAVKERDVNKAIYHLSECISLCKMANANNINSTQKSDNERTITNLKRILFDLQTYGITSLVLEKLNIKKDGVSIDNKKASEGYVSNYASNSYPSNQNYPSNTSNSQGFLAGFFEQNIRSVVCIKVTCGLIVSSGTGFIIGDGVLLTNHHVVENNDGSISQNVSMSFYGEKTSYPIKVINSDKTYDVAVCSFDVSKVSNYKKVKFMPNYNSLLPGADCVVIGNSLSQGLNPSQGTIRFLRNSKDNLVYTIPINVGDSGAPVFNRQGQVIGINKSITLRMHSTDANNFANATPSPIILKLLERWNVAI